MTPDTLGLAYLFAPLFLPLSSPLCPASLPPFPVLRHNHHSQHLPGFYTPWFFFTQDVPFVGTCVKWKFLFFKVQLKFPLSRGEYSPVFHPELPSFCLSSHSPVVTWLSPLCAASCTLFVCLPLPPSVSRLRQIPVKFPGLYSQCRHKVCFRRGA